MFNWKEGFKGGRNKTGLLEGSAWQRKTIFHSPFCPLFSCLESRRLSNNNIYLSDRISITDVNICYFLFFDFGNVSSSKIYLDRAAELAKIGEQIEIVELS